MKLQLLAIEKEGFLRVASEGEITMADFPAEDRNPFEGVIGQNWTSNRVLLDMSRTGYVDSSAVGWLLGSHKQFKAGGGLLVVHSIPPAVAQVFELLKIDKVLVTAPDEAAARAMVSGGEA